jgi:hypothetical protein
MTHIYCFLPSLLRRNFSWEPPCLLKAEPLATSSTQMANFRLSWIPLPRLSKSPSIASIALSTEAHLTRDRQILGASRATGFRQFCHNSAELTLPAPIPQEWYDQKNLVMLVEEAYSFVHFRSHPREWQLPFQDQEKDELTECECREKQLQLAVGFVQANQRTQHTSSWILGQVPPIASAQWIRSLRSSPLRARQGALQNHLDS